MAKAWFLVSGDVDQDAQVSLAKRPDAMTLDPTVASEARQVFSKNESDKTRVWPVLRETMGEPMAAQADTLVKADPWQLLTAALAHSGLTVEQLLEQRECVDTDLVRSVKREIFESLEKGESATVSIEKIMSMVER